MYNKIINYIKKISLELQTNLGKFFFPFCHDQLISSQYSHFLPPENRRLSGIFWRYKMGKPARNALNGM